MSVLMGRGFQFALLTLATIAASYARTVVSPLQETMRVAMSLSDNQMALLQGPAMAFPVVLAAVPLGLLIDRRSRARLLLALAALNLLGSFLTALSTSFAVLFAARCLAGLAASATFTGAFSLLADLYAPAQRGRANMVLAIAQVAGSSAAFALGGVLLALASASHDWRWAMSWLSAAMIPAAVLLFWLREPARMETRLENTSLVGACREMWRYRTAVLPLLAGVVMFSIADCAAMIWAAPTLSRMFSLSPEKVGAIMGGIVLVSGIVGGIVGGVLSDICQRSGGPARTLSAMTWMVVAGIPTGLFAVMPGVASASTFLALFITIGGVIAVGATTLSTIVIPNELRGLFLAILFAFGTIFGIGFAPLMVSLLSGLLGGTVMIGKALAVVCVVTSLIGAATFAFGTRFFRWREVPSS